MFFVCISEQTAIFASYSISRLVLIIKVENVYCAVRTESLYNTDTLRRQGVKVCKVAYSEVNWGSNLDVNNLGLFLGTSGIISTACTTAFPHPLYSSNTFSLCS
jgi:hypothetical protein